MAQSLHYTKRARLQPFTDLFHQILVELDEQPTLALEKTVDAASAATSTNCGWVTYCAAQVVFGQGSRILLLRRLAGK